MGQLHCMASKPFKVYILLYKRCYGNFDANVDYNIARWEDKITWHYASYMKEHYLIRCQCLESIVNDFCNRQGVVSG